MRNRSQFAWKRFLKSLMVIALPVALQNMLTTTGSMVDTMMIAPLGETTVGAVGLCAQFSSLMFAGYWGFVGGGMLFFSQYWGAQDDDGIERSYGLTLMCMMCVGLLACGFAVFAPELVMGLYTDKQSIQTIGVQYLRIVGFAYPLQVFSVAMSALLRSTERVRIPLYASIVSVLSNIFLNWVFIYGKLGAGAMGVQGAALATTCAAAINVAVTLVLARRQNYRYLFRFRSHFRWNRALVKMYFVKCFPILCNEVLIGVGNMVINIVLGRQSEQAIAAIAVFRTLEGMVISFFSGFSSAASVLVGAKVGAGELEEAYERAKRLVLLCGGTIAALCLVLIAVHKPLLGVMSLSGESLRLGSGLLMIYCAAGVIRMCNWTQNDTFRSAGDASFGTILEITFMYCMVLPAVCLSGLVWKLPFLMVFVCCYLDEPIRFLLMQRHLYSGKWIRPVTPQGMAALAGFRKKHSKTEKGETK